MVIIMVKEYSRLDWNIIVGIVSCIMVDELMLEAVVFMLVAN
jgi:hypothetical protein